MIRVAFLIKFNDSWLGGINYFRNLLCAISENTSTKISPIIFTGKKINRKLLNGFPEVELIESEIFDTWSFPWIKRQIDKQIFFQDRLLENLLEQHHIDVLSHITGMSGRIKTPLIGWIPDFQHRHLPHLFTKRDLKYRDRSFKNLCDVSKAIILSSYDAKKDLQEFFPGVESKAHVLQFVVQPPLSDEEPSLKELEQIYGFEGNYFYVPNQFWAHKNHQVLLEALSILKKQERKVLVISTGNTEDYRNPEYFRQLSRFMQDHNLTDQFKILGKVSYAHVVSLAKYSTALLNPSLFEGWSTSVEEAKSLGKRIILSDIPVHREQNPTGGVYFDPHNAEELAKILWEVWQSTGTDTILQRNAQQVLEQRRIQFAKTYQKIVLDVFEK